MTPAPSTPRPAPERREEAPDLSPEAVEALAKRFDNPPKQHRRGEPLAEVVYADPGNNGWYYREKRFGDTVAAYVRVDLLALRALAAPDEEGRG